MSKINNVALFKVFSFFDSFDFFAPIRIFYFFQVTHSYTQAASLVSLIWIFTALWEIPTGIFSDFIGRKKTIVVGSFCILLSYFIYALGSNYWVMVFGTLILGAGRAFFSGNNNAYMYELLGRENGDDHYHDIYGKVNTIQSISYFLAAVASGFFVNYSANFLMWGCVGTQFVMFVLSLFLQEVKVLSSEGKNVFLHLKESISEIRGNIKLRYLSIMMIFAGAGEASYEFQSAVFAFVWPTWAIGIARGLQETTSIPGYYFAKHIIKKVGVGNILLLQSFVSWGGAFLAVILHNILSPFVIIAGYIVYGPYDTATQNMLQQEFTDRQRATIASLNSLGQSIYFAIVLNLAGLIVAYYNNPFVGVLVTQILFIPVIYYRFKLFFALKKPSLT